jgi:hypothetical protein
MNRKEVTLYISSGTRLRAVGLVYACRAVWTHFARCLVLVVDARVYVRDAQRDWVISG